MLAASIPGDPRFTIDDCEIRRGGVSFTIDTIAGIKSRYRCEGKPALVIGDDLARGFSLGRKADDIVREADIIIAHRESAEKASFPYPYTPIDNPIMELSSASIRERIENRKAWRSLVPPGARFIIEDRRLYGYAPGPSAAAEASSSAAEGPMAGKKESERADGRIDGTGKARITRELIARVEAEVRSLVSPSRFLHSRGAALFSYDLCLHFGLDPDRGYLAGIAHDMAKSLPEDEMKRLVKKNNEPFSKEEREKPALLHGKAAAILLREKFGVEDGDILEAICYHTTGKAGMGPLAQAVYVADKIETTRGGVKAEFRDFSRYADLDSLFSAVLEDTVAYLRSKQMDLSAGTLRLLDAIHQRRPL
jgi:nicotinate-nucleotide adenylyltransferase